MRKLYVLLVSVVLCAPHGRTQEPPAPSIKTVTVEEVVLDLVVRDKKGKPVTDLTPDQIAVSDNGSKQTLTSFRLVRGKEAVTPKGAVTTLEPLRQLRLVTLAFDALGPADQRKTARTAALDLIKAEQGTNVFYSVVVINTRLFALQPFTTDKDALAKAIERATNGLAATTLNSESDSVQQELRRNLGGQTASQAMESTAGSGTPSADQFVQAKLASVMLDILR
jgi:VWFA-related protein